MYKLMLVDDQRIVMEGIARMLEGFDLPFRELLILENGREALEYIERFRPDAVLIDICMPDMDGLSFCERLRRRGDAFADTPVVILSGYKDFEYARAAITNRVFHYLLKPVNGAELYSTLSLVAKALDEARAPQSVSRYNLRENIIRNALGSFSDAENAVTEADGGGYTLLQLLWEEGGDFSLASVLDILGSEVHAVYSRETEAYILVRGVPDLSSANRRVEINVSLPFERLADMDKALRQLCTVHLQRQDSSEEPSLLTYSDIRSRGEQRTYSGAAPLIAAIEAADTRGVARILDELRARLEADEHAPKEWAVDFFASLCMEIYRHFYSLTLLQQSREEFEFLLDCANRLARLPSIRDMTRETERHIRKLVSDIHKEADIDIVSAAKNIMRAEPTVSLSALASRLYVSDSYLSTLFHQQTGQSFKEYLTRCRIELALRLLDEGGRTVSEIGNMVGYTSEKHFFVVFKKATGQSPAKYRLNRQLSNR